jgi:2-keto-4-pentenoate hydratase
MTLPQLANSGLDEAAALLVAARLRGIPLARLPDEATPGSDADAYAIQDRVGDRLGWTIGGWKAGLGKTGDTSSAPLYAPVIQPSPARLDATGRRIFGIEGEIAFRFARALPAGTMPHDRQTVSDAIESAHAAIEILDTRYTELDGRSRFEMLADTFNNAGFVPGPPLAAWRDLDFPRLKVTLSLDGDIVFEGVGTHPVGDPLAPVIWFANFLNARGRAIQAGDYVTTGTCTGFLRARIGSLVQVRFDGLGEAELRFD